MVLVFGAMGLFYDWLVQQSILFVVIYGLTFFFSNFGPNSTTFIVPGEVFPAEIRATCHGLSSAAGKVGAILGMFHISQPCQKCCTDASTPGSSLFAPVAKLYGYQVVFYGCAAVSLMGLGLTFLVPETKGMALTSHMAAAEDEKPLAGDDA